MLTLAELQQQWLNNLTQQMPAAFGIQAHGLSAAQRLQVYFIKAVKKQIVICGQH